MFILEVYYYVFALLLVPAAEVFWPMNVWNPSENDVQNIFVLGV